MQRERLHDEPRRGERHGDWLLPLAIV
jgi:hypothetical protein